MSSNNHLVLRETSPTTLEFLTSSGKTLGAYNWGNDRRHPFFHPLYSYEAKSPLMVLGPWDHPWHKGLWYSWKYLNDILFWETPPSEPDDEEGGSWVTEHSATATPEGTIRIRETVEMRDIKENRLILTEDRKIEILPTIPGMEGAWGMDWDMVWTAPEDCQFGVTPITEATPWGGYSGLTFRAARCMADGEQFLSSEGADTCETIHHKTARWVAYAGNIDGNEHDSYLNPAKAGVVFFDHPENHTYPSPWYVGTARDCAGIISPAVELHKSPFLKKGEQLRLRYRIAFFDGAPVASILENASKAIA